MAKRRLIKNKGGSGERPSQDVILLPSLLADIRRLIESARSKVASTVNSELVFLYWRVGPRIRQEVLDQRRAEYGERIVSALSRQLTVEYGGGFSEKSLRHMLRFADIFPDEPIVSALPRELGWSHFLEILYLPDPRQRAFYIEMCRIERWSIRTLRERVRTMLFERTAVSKSPEKLIERELKSLKEDGRLSPDLVFRDPYFLDFLGLRGEYKEKEIEEAIVRELERFILELGADFAFVARQKRISVDNEDYYLDLLFYHRRLRRLVAIDLKLGKFQAADKGQMELYLRWLDRYERHPFEDSPIGLILCAGKSNEHVELLRLDQANIRVAEYLTELPPRKLLEDRLHTAIELARQRFDRAKL
ncbi:MAG TPA: PDDEXK nuclease domain-containing protein [Humisphaera sp.]|nr:PDDEXK nuclease domain-containing protein [Humisphaera sp.]